ncbi:MAG: AMP-binding protein [Pirellulales bacterium]|nr:AMP-binding protein [Pirellulales bacterium]
MRLVHDSLQQSAQRTPDKIALVCDGRRLTYAQIDTMANQLANALRDHGVARGDRVALYLPNTIELVVAIFATLKADGVFVVVNSTTKADKLAHVIGNCRATAMVTGARQADLALEMIRDLPSLEFAVLSGRTSTEAAGDHAELVAFDAILEEYSTSRPDRRCIDQDLACLIYTSGSSGDPKGVMSAHCNVVFAASSIISYLKNQPDDIVICALPLSFDYGLYQLLMTFQFGGTLVLERSFAYPAQFLQQMETERVTGFPGVPTIFAILLQMDLSSYDLSRLRYITNTAAALPPSHIQQLRGLFPSATVYSMYGLTETKRTLYLPPDQLDARPGSVGIAIPGTEVWLVDENDNRLGPNEVGELVIRGGHVMRGYWENPEATAERYRPGPIPGERVCYSGDLLRMDEAGYFYFVGRKDDIIKSRGEKVAPKEVENVLYALPGVVEAAVIGVPDAILGQAIKALIVTGNGELTEKHVWRHCRENLEDFMVPKYVEFVVSLPKTTSGKIRKTALA